MDYNDNKFYGESEGIAKKLVEKYQGLRIDDLCRMNTEYSCVLCATSSCKNYMKSRRACPNHIKLSVEEWCKVYNFKVGAQ